MDILWSPNHADKFVTFGPELCLYKVDKTSGGKEASSKEKGFKISDDTYASLLSVNSDNQYMKCLAWYPKSQPDNLLAVGLANGHVVLTSFGKAGQGDPNNLIGKEFVPRHARQCNYLEWNPVECNLLAEGLERYRADYSILIWDVNYVKHSADSGYGKASTGVEPTISKPHVELGSAETTLSLSWFTHTPKTLVTGMNHKFLRIFDLRDTSHPQSVAYTKAVGGVTVDPHFEYRLASYVDDQDGKVCIWDTRNFDKPVITLLEGKHVAKLTWTPTRSGLLAVLPRDSSIVKLYDIQQSAVGSDELEPAVIERIIQPFTQSIVSSFDWHWTNENRMLAINPSGAIKDLRIFERIAVNWSPDIHLMWSCGRTLTQCNSIKLCREASEDISIKMKRRALKGYALKTENLSENGQLVAEDARLKGLWNWLDRVRKLSWLEEPTVRGKTMRGTIRYQGVKAILKEGAAAQTRSELDFLHWQGLEGTRPRTQKRIFRSEPRSRALELCGWGFDKDNVTLGEALDRLESNGEFERAAAIALFNLHMRRAIQALGRGSASRPQGGSIGDVNLNVVAMAVSGFTDDKLGLWREMCSSLSLKLDNPYLRAMFAFLTSETDSHDLVLNESGMDVMDKVAYACMYLADAKLLEYIEKLTAILKEDGNLDGILLTGITTDGVDLLGSYVDLTSDVQTAAFVCMQGFPCMEITKDPRVQDWIENYRILLDTWRLWNQRAEFDVYRIGCDNTNRPSQQVFVSCNYCSKSVAYNMLASRNRHFMYGGTTAHKPKMTSCPGCRKPLPRCALCLVNMGTAAGTGKFKHHTAIEAQLYRGRGAPMSQFMGPPSNPRKSKRSISEGEEEKLSQFSDWFTWCQTCRHGGHARHMTEWFREHKECPVTGCTCCCTSLDSMGGVLTQDTTTSVASTPS